MKTISKIVIGICIIPAFLLALPLVLLKLTWEIANGLLDEGLDAGEKRISRK